MPKIVIIGNSSAGFFCSDAFLKNLKDPDLTIISQEDTLPYKKNLLIDYLAGNIKEAGLFLCPKDFYEKNKIKFLKNSKVVRVDIKKQLVVLKDNAKINYDYLVIATGANVDILDIPGKTKNGVFAFYSLQEAVKIKERLMISDDVCIVGSTPLALRLGEIFAQKNKHVKIILSIQPQDFVGRENLEWLSNLQLTEIIGEGAELKALKLNNGKVIGASLILFTGNFIPATQFLKETQIRLDKNYIMVDGMMRTNFENIFACGSVCRNQNNLDQQKSWDEAKAEGILVSENLINLISAPANNSITQ